MTYDYDTFSTRLAGTGLLLTAAEVHGMVCGQICSSTEAYNALLTLQMMGQDTPDAALLSLLDELAAESGEQLSESAGFSFVLLLPDEDEDLGLRLYALGRWCEGFTLGFAAGCSASGVALPDEAREVLADFARIAEVDTADGDDEDEADYTQVMEYVRVAAATLYARDDAAGHENDDESTLH